MASTDTETSRNPLKTVRLIVWTLAGVAALILGFLLLRPQGEPEAQVQQQLPGFTLGGPFTLTGADGKPFSSRQLAGKPYAMFFGFTNCPDVCPNTLGRLASLRQELEKGEDSFEIVFVSVDPERDTPEAVGAYARMFDTPVIGLTGTPQQVAQVAKQHGIYHAKVAQPDLPDGYTVDHGSAVLLFDAEGNFVSTIAQEEANAPALDKLRRITA